MREPWGDQMRDVLRAQFKHAADSHYLDRHDWTPDQWVDDARRLMNDVDGSVLDLLNGHVNYMLKKIDEQAQEIARLRAIIAQHGDTDTHWANGQPRLLRPEAYDRLRHTVGDTNT